MRSARTDAESDGVPKNQIRIGVDYKKRCTISKWKWYWNFSKTRNSRKKKILEVILHIVNEQDNFFLPMKFAVFQLFHENVCIFCIDSIY
jgi:hypothetical protein